MNGGANSNYGYDDVGPGPKQIMAGYRNDMMNGSAPDKPRYNPVRRHAQSLSLDNLSSTC